MKIIKSSQKKQIIEKLNQQFGISKIPYLLLQFGEKKIRAYSGSLSSEELSKLDKTINIETIGLYFINIEDKDNELRLTLDACNLLKNQISKNILEINNKQAELWLKGNDLDIQTSKGFKIIKNNNEILGCGKSTNLKITNFIPKNRRVK